MSDRSIGMDLSQTACAFAVLRFRSDNFMDVVACRIADLREDEWRKLTPWSLCAVAWGFGELYPEPGQSKDSHYDGAWDNGAVIRGNSLLWSKGAVARLIQHEDGTIYLMDGAATHTGRLTDNGQRISWSDNDVWVKAKQPFATFQKRVWLEVKRRKLTGRVADVPLGPERWFKQ